jgi:hypothetical protein
MSKIYEKAKSCKEGTWFLTLTKNLLKYASTDNSRAPGDEEWEMVLQTKKPMSWAPATVYLYRKIK